jgi:hypothetical protein
VRTDGNRVAEMFCALVCLRPEQKGFKYPISATRMCRESGRTDCRFAAAMSWQKKGRKMSMTGKGIDGRHCRGG